MKLGIAMARIGSIGASTAIACVSCSSAAVHSEDPSQYTDVISCDSACHNLHRLGCESAASIPKCRAFCEKVQRSHYLTLPLNCVCAATSRREARLCGTQCSGDE